MRIDHWTDEEFQRYIDGELLPTDSLRIRHLHTCPSCRETLGQYRLLYRMLKTELECVIPESFARTAAVRAMRKPFYIPAWRNESVLIPAGLAAILGTWFMVYHPPYISMVTKGFLKFTVELKTLFVPLLPSITAQMVRYLPGVLIGAGFLALTAMLDRFLLRSRLQRNSRLGASSKEL
jgi:hypothetical protein